MPNIYALTGCSGNGKSRLISSILNSNGVQQVLFFEIEECLSEERFGDVMERVAKQAKVLSKEPIGYVFKVPALYNKHIPILTSELHKEVGSWRLQEHDYVLYELMDSSTIATDSNTVATHTIHVPTPQQIAQNLFPKQFLHLKLDYPSKEWITAVRFIRQYIIEEEEEAKSTDPHSTFKTLLNTLENAKKNTKNANNTEFSIRTLDYFVKYLNLLLCNARSFLNKPSGTLRRHEKVFLVSQFRQSLAVVGAGGDATRTEMSVYFTEDKMYVSRPKEKSQIQNTCSLSKVIYKLNQNIHNWAYLDDIDKISRVNHLLSLLSLPCLIADIDEDPDPLFSITRYNMQLLVHIHYRFTLNIPVILSGTSGSGKTSLINYLRVLYHHDDNNFIHLRVKHFTKSEIEAAINVIESDDTVIVLFDDITDQKCLDYILKIVTSRRINGVEISEKIKFVIELTSTEGDKEMELYDSSKLVMDVEIDYQVIHNMIKTRIECSDSSGIYEIILSLHQNIGSYRVVGNFTKVFSWVKQVLVGVLSGVDLRVDESESDDTLSTVISIYTCYQRYFPTLQDMLTCITSNVQESDRWKRCYVNVCGVLFDDVVTRSISVSSSLLSLLICIETNIPLFTDSLETFHMFREIIENGNDDRGVNESGNDDSGVNESGNDRNVLSSFLPIIFSFCDVMQDNVRPEAVLLSCYSKCLEMQSNSAKQDHFKQNVLVIEHTDLLDSGTNITLKALLDHGIISIICCYSNKSKDLTTRPESPRDMQTLLDYGIMGVQPGVTSTEIEDVSAGPCKEDDETVVDGCIDVPTVSEALRYLNLPHNTLEHLELHVLEFEANSFNKCKDLLLTCVKNKMLSRKPVCIISDEPLKLLFSLERYLTKSEVYVKVLGERLTEDEIIEMVKFIRKNSKFLILLKPDTASLVKFLKVIQRDKTKEEMLYLILTDHYYSLLQTTHLFMYLKSKDIQTLAGSSNESIQDLEPQLIQHNISSSVNILRQKQLLISSQHSDEKENLFHKINTKYSYLKCLPLNFLKQFIIITIPQTYHQMYLPNNWNIINLTQSLNHLADILDENTAETICFVCKPKDVLQIRFNIQTLPSEIPTNIILLTNYHETAQPSLYWDNIFLPQYITINPKPGYKILLEMISTNLSRYQGFLKEHFSTLYCSLDDTRKEFSLFKQWNLYMFCLETILIDILSSYKHKLYGDISELKMETARLSLIKLGDVANMRNLFIVVDMLEYAVSFDEEMGQSLVEMVLKKQLLFDRYIMWKSRQCFQHRLKFPYSWIVYQIAEELNLKKNVDETLVILLSRIKFSPKLEELFMKDLVVFIINPSSYHIYEKLFLLLSNIIKNRTSANILDFARRLLRVWDSRPDLPYLAEISQLYIANILKDEGDLSVNVRLVKVGVWELCRVLEWGSGTDEEMCERLQSYIRLLDGEEMRREKEKWKAECKSMKKISVFKVEEKEEISSLKTSLQYLEIFSKLSSQFGTTYTGTITNFVKTFFASDWFSESLTYLMEWVKPKQPITGQTNGSHDTKQPIMGEALQLLVEMFDVERCEELVKQGLKMLEGDVLYRFLAYNYRCQDVCLVRRICGEISSPSSSLISAIVLCEEEQCYDITDDVASESCIKVDSTSLTTLEQIQHIARTRVALCRFSDRLVEIFTTNENIATEEISKIFAKDKHDYYSQITTLLCKTNNICIKMFIMRILLERMGLGALNVVLSKISVLNFDHKIVDKDVRNNPDFCLCLSRYHKILELLLPACKLCERKSYNDLSPIYILLAYYNTRPTKCDCVEKIARESEQEELLRKIDETSVVREEYQDDIWVKEHMCHLIYLSYLLNSSCHSNTFLEFFRQLYILPTEKLNKMYWMGMPEDIFSAIRVALTEEWVKKDKQYSYYVCPNNHVYGVNNCGDPEEESDCPTCGCKIGGINHDLLSTNRRLDENYKFLTETGHNLDPGRVAGVEKIREMDKCSTNVLWYITHLVLLLKETAYEKNSDGRPVNISEEISLAVKGVSVSSGLSHDISMMLLLRVIQCLGQGQECDDDQSTQVDSALQKRSEWETMFCTMTNQTLSVCVKEKGEMERSMYDGLGRLVNMLFNPGDHSQSYEEELFYNNSVWISGIKRKTNIEENVEEPQDAPLGSTHMQYFIDLRQRTNQKIVSKPLPVKVLNVAEYLGYLTGHITSDDQEEGLDNGLEEQYYCDMWRILQLLTFCQTKEPLLRDYYYCYPRGVKVDRFIEKLTEDVEFEVQKEFAGLLVEYVVLFVRFKEPGFLESWSLSEALEFYLDLFFCDDLRKRDENILKSVEIDDDVLVGHLGYILDSMI